MKTLSRSRQPSAGPRVKTAASRTVQPEHPPAAGTNGDGPGGGFALEILDAMLAFRSGNFSRELPSGWTGVYGKIADAFNDIVNSNRRRAGETARICRVVGKEGKLKQRLRVTGLAGQWADEVDSLRSLLDQHFDCAVLDLRLPDISGFELLDRIQEDPGLREIPIVVFTGKDLSPDEERHFESVARSVVLKDVQSPERLLDETALFLHRVVSDLPTQKQEMLDRLHSSDEDLVGKQVLVVDDDVRNIFALSSVLERRGMAVLTASTGREAIATLGSTPGSTLGINSS